MNKAAIERAARSLQLEIYQSAKNLYPSGLPPFTQLFAPDVAARICGYEYELRPDLGQGEQAGSGFGLPASLCAIGRRS